MNLAVYKIDNSNRELVKIFYIYLFHAELFFIIFVIFRYISKLTFYKDSFRNTIRVSNGWDPDQVLHSVMPGLGTNCLQKLSADNKSWHWQAEFTNLNAFENLHSSITLIVYVSSKDGAKSAYMCRHTLSLV